MTSSGKTRNLGNVLYLSYTSLKPAQTGYPNGERTLLLTDAPGVLMVSEADCDTLWLPIRRLPQAGDDRVRSGESAMESSADLSAGLATTGTQAIGRAHAIAQRVRANVSRVIVGKEDVIDL